MRVRPDVWKCSEPKTHPNTCGVGVGLKRFGRALALFLTADRRAMGVFEIHTRAFGVNRPRRGLGIVTCQMISNYSITQPPLRY